VRRAGGRTGVQGHTQESSVLGGQKGRNKEGKGRENSPAKLLRPQASWPKEATELPGRIGGGDFCASGSFQDKGGGSSGDRQEEFVSCRFLRKVQPAALAPEKKKEKGESVLKEGF